MSRSNGLLHLEAAGGLAMVLTALGPVAARLFFYPTLLYTLVREWLPGSQRPWFSRIDRAVLLGALPLRGRCRQLVEDENVRGVVTMNEEYETRFLCCSSQIRSLTNDPSTVGFLSGQCDSNFNGSQMEANGEEWAAMGVEQLRLSTVDLTGVPSLENLHKGVEFVLKHREHGNSVYVHCKAGRFRSATMVAAYLIQLHQWTPQEAIKAISKIRPHIIIRQKQAKLLEDFHRCVTIGTPAQQQLPKIQQVEDKPTQDILNPPLKTSGS